MNRALLDGTGTPITVGCVVTWPTLEEGKLGMRWGVVRSLYPVVAQYSFTVTHGIQMAQAVYPSRTEQHIACDTLENLYLVTVLPHFFFTEERGIHSIKED